MELEAERLDYSFRLKLLHNTVKKEIRIRRLSGPFASGAIRFVRGCPGNDLLVTQCQEFPFGSHDDGPDSLEMLFQLWQAENRKLWIGDDDENDPVKRVFKTRATGNLR